MPMCSMMTMSTIHVFLDFFLDFSMRISWECGLLGFFRLFNRSDRKFLFFKKLDHFPIAFSEDNITIKTLSSEFLFSIINIVTSWFSSRFQPLLEQKILFIHHVWILSSASSRWIDGYVMSISLFWLEPQTLVRSTTSQNNASCIKSTEGPVLIFIRIGLGHSPSHHRSCHHTCCRCCCVSWSDDIFTSVPKRAIQSGGCSIQRRWSYKNHCRNQRRRERGAA